MVAECSLLLVGIVFDKCKEMVSLCLEGIPQFYGVHGNHLLCAFFEKDVIYGLGFRPGQPAYYVFPCYPTNDFIGIFIASQHVE